MSRSGPRPIAHLKQTLPVIEYIHIDRLTPGNPPLMRNSPARGRGRSVPRQSAGEERPSVSGDRGVMSGYSPKPYSWRRLRKVVRLMESLAARVRWLMPSARARAMMSRSIRSWSCSLAPAESSAVL